MLGGKEERRRRALYLLCNLVEEIVPIHSSYVVRYMSLKKMLKFWREYLWICLTSLYDGLSLISIHINQKTGKAKKKAEKSVYTKKNETQIKGIENFEVLVDKVKCIIYI